MSYFRLCLCIPDICNFRQVLWSSFGIQIRWSESPILPVARRNLCYSWNFWRGFILQGPLGCLWSWLSASEPILFPDQSLLSEASYKDLRPNFTGGFRGKGRHASVAIWQCTARKIFKLNCGFPCFKFLWSFLISGHFLPEPLYPALTPAFWPSLRALFFPQNFLLFSSFPGSLTYPTPGSQAVSEQFLKSHYFLV